MRRSLLRYLIVLLLALPALAGCSGAPETAAADDAILPLQPTLATPTTGSEPSPLPSSTPTRAAPATPTPVSTAVSTATSTPSPTPSPTYTATPLSPCSQRQPDRDDLLILVSRDYGLSRDYVPPDLVPLSDYFPVTITLGYPTEVRQILIEPLQALLTAMQDEGLSPLIISGYRDYYAQSIARDKWLEQYPEWANHLSAPPGHSEHQLGTTLDLGSPELPELVGEKDIQFHPAFARTSEGQWLAAHAHEYGFTMSYPADRFEETAFYYEPWHFRYVGVELATRLFEEGQTISDYLLEAHGEPCLAETD